MKLQLALDDLKIEDAIRITERVQEYIDIIELGTPLIYREGMNAVKNMKKLFPKKEIMADMKIMDAGFYEASEGFEAGADYVTVLGVTDILTIKECLDAAGRYNKNIIADMICVQDIPTKIREFESIGVERIAVHTGVDQQMSGKTALLDLIVMKENCRTIKISVAGGINVTNIEDYIKHMPEILIVGGGICHTENPEESAKKIRNSIEKAAG